MSDSIFNVNPVTGVSGNYSHTDKKETSGSTASIMANLLSVMKSLKESEGWKYLTTYDLASAAYDVVAVKGYARLQSVFPSKDYACQMMESEYRKRMLK